MKKITLILCFLLGIYSYSQKDLNQLQVDYENVSRAGVNVLTPCSLYFSNNVAKFTTHAEKAEEIDKKEIDKLSDCETCPQSKSIFIKTGINNYYYQDLNSNLLYSYYLSFKKNFQVKENLPIGEWKLGDKQKEILGYKCQSASITYKGRDWEVYFTNAIPIPLGPWKLGGLSGLILEAKSVDGMYHYTATKISAEIDKEINLKDDYSNYLKNTFLTWSEYFELVNKKLYESNKKTWSEDDETGSGFLVIEPTMENIYNVTNDKIRKEFYEKWGNPDEAEQQTTQK